MHETDEGLCDALVSLKLVESRERAEAVVRYLAGRTGDIVDEFNAATARASVSFGLKERAVRAAMISALRSVGFIVHGAASDAGTTIVLELRATIPNAMEEAP